MNFLRPIPLLSLVLGLAAASPASAALLPLTQASFGGTGIPNDQVAVAIYDGPSFDITLGLTAHQRYGNPALTNNGTDTFYATPGGDGAHGQPGYANWNLGFYIGFDPLSPSASLWYLAGNTVTLKYDLNPAAGNGTTNEFDILGAVYGLYGLPALQANGVYQDSWNLGMSFLNTGPFASFDPSALGEYDFSLVVKEGNYAVATSAIKVVVTNSPPSVPDGGPTLLLLSLALVAVGAISRRQRD